MRFVPPIRQLIVASDHVGREFVMWYLNSAFNAYQKVQESLQSGLSDVHSVVLPPIQMTRSSMEGGKEDNKALRKRIEQLEARLKKPVRRKRRKATR